MLTFSEYCTYWEYKGQGAYGPVYLPPKVIKCKWETKQELVRTGTGEEKLSNSRIYVRDSVAPNGMLARGKYDSNNPPSTAHTIMAVEEAKSLFFDQTLTKIYL